MPRVINTKDELCALRQEIYEEILEKNPGRDFSVLLGGNEWPSKVGVVVIWHDGKGELIE